jgi:hypothetical protein
MDNRLIMATKLHDKVIIEPAVDELVEFIRKNKIVHLSFDPLINTSRGLTENSNDDMEELASTYLTVAAKTGSSVDIVHHTPKHAQNQRGDLDAARGASSFGAAVRSALTVMPLSDSDVRIKQLAGRIIQVDMAKANYARLDPAPKLFRLSSVCINNGPDAGSEFPDGDAEAFSRSLGDSIGVLELIDQSEVSASAASAAHNARYKVLAAVAQAMGSAYSIRQSKIMESLMAQLQLGRSKTYDALGRHLPFGEPQRVSIEDTEWELVRKPVGRGPKATGEITRRIVGAEANAGREQAA